MEKIKLTLPLKIAHDCLLALEFLGIVLQLSAFLNTKIYAVPYT